MTAAPAQCAPVVAGAGAESAADDCTAVRVANLGRSIDGHPILRDVSFALPRGRYASLLGANGAGKSTLLKILATLLPPSCGGLTLFGSPVRRSSIAVRARLGLVGHATMLYRNLTARENLVFFGRLYGIADPAARADELLEFIGLADRGHDAVKTFSRGMAQRVAIARALVHDPDLLLADEPFAGLDTPSRETLEQALDRLHRQGRTIVLANHDIEQSMRITEHVLVLRGGRLVLDEPSAQVELPAVRAEVIGP